MYYDLECITFKLVYSSGRITLLAIHATLVPLLFKQNFYIKQKKTKKTKQIGNVWCSPKDGFIVIWTYTFSTCSEGSANKVYVVTVSHVPPSRLVVLGAAVPPSSLLSGITGDTSVNNFLQILLKLFITNCQVLCMLSEHFAFVDLCTLVT